MQTERERKENNGQIEERKTRCVWRRGGVNKREGDRERDREREMERWRRDRERGMGSGVSQGDAGSYRVVPRLRQSIRDRGVIKVVSRYYDGWGMHNRCRPNVNIRECLQRQRAKML
jgi:hypothetical protein